MRPDPSRLGANVGFGYLGDDDDDDATGGAVAAEFEALVSNDTGDNSVLYGDLINYTVVPTASSAQTNGEVTVWVQENYGDFVDPNYDVVPVTSSTGGWIQTGWSKIADRTYVNVFTKASVAAGTTAIQFYVDLYVRGDELTNGSSVGSLRVKTSFVAPHTSEATGLGNEDEVSIHILGGG